MPLIENEFHELYRSDDFELPKMMKLNYTDERFMNASEPEADADIEDLLVCAHCGQPFVRRIYNQKYCCRGCANRAHSREGLR